MNRDNYDKEILRALKSIAGSLKNIDARLCKMEQSKNLDRIDELQRERTELGLEKSKKEYVIGGEITEECAFYDNGKCSCQKWAPQTSCMGDIKFCEKPKNQKGEMS